MLPKLSSLYEDNHVLVVYKPAGTLSQGDLTGDLDILTLAKETIRRRDKKRGNVYLGLVHRLDRPVSGVMVIAKTSKAAGRLARQFRERETLKIYQAVVEGRPVPDKAELRHRLNKDRDRRITHVVGPNEDGRDALLTYRVIDSQFGNSLVEINLTTGLPHQIRVQLSVVGHPVIGDIKYGSKTRLRGGNIALVAKSITFVHPTKKVPVTVTAKMPANWPWK